MNQTKGLSTETEIQGEHNRLIRVNQLEPWKRERDNSRGNQQTNGNKEIYENVRTKSIIDGR